MRIQHNIPALNAERNLRKNRGSLQKNLEKLSSGYRINRSADDAAGLAISEKMRASIACVEQAENNVQDGIALVQTADGAMQEIQDMLNRMTALSAQAANGSISDEERAHIQREIDEILKEITRIRNGTYFNSVPLLQGNDGGSYIPPEIRGGLPGWVTHTPTGTLTDTHTTTESYTSATGTPATGTAQVDHAAAVLDFNNGFNKDDLLGEDVGFYSTCCTCSDHYSIKFTDEATNSIERSGSHYIYNVGIANVNDADALVDAIIAATGGNPNGHYTFLEEVSPGKLVIYDERPSNDDFMTGIPSDAKFDSMGYNQHYIVTPSQSSGRGLFGTGVAYDQSTQKIGDIVLQIDEGENDRLKIDLPNVSLNLLGISGLSVTTAKNALNAISKIKGAIAYVSGERGRMGAYQNRLEHTYEFLGVKVENLTRAESQLRDADMAEEMMAYTKNNILVQSAQAMLAHSNQTPQGVLQLMK